MKQVLKDWLKKSSFKIILTTIFIFLNMYFFTYPPKITGEIVDLFQNLEENKVLIYEKLKELAICTFFIVLLIISWRILIGDIVLNFEKSVKDKLYKKVMKVPISFLQSTKNGELMTYFTKDVNDLRRLIFCLLSLTIRIVFVMIISIGTMVKDINFKFTIISLSPLIVTLFLILIIINKIEKASKISRNCYSDVSEYVQESTDGIRTIKAYSGEESRIKEFEIRNKNLRDSEVKVSFFSMLLSTITRLGFGLCIGISVLYGSKLVLENKITIGDLVAFNGYLMLFVNPIRWIPNIITRYKNAKISYNRLNEIFNLETEKIEEFKIEKGKISGDIKFNDLTFNYPSNIEVNLKNINLEIKQGQTLGIIGTIGSGKTTLMNLLLRLYEIPNNKITIGGKDINSIPLNDLRNSICYITQENFLFSTTIKDNISLFREEFSENEIIESTKNAMIYDEIQEMDDGIHTIIGERGIDLSGGQKQRVVISRAFLQRSNIVIFDDTFSALDNRTEEFLLKNIKELTKGKTCIIISNRISDIKDADKIIVLDDGEIIQSGIHKNLIKEKGLYQKFYNQQSSKQNQEVGELIG